MKLGGDDGFSVLSRLRLLVQPHFLFGGRLVCTGHLQSRFNLTPGASPVIDLSARRDIHADGLITVAEKAGRPLDLIVRGGIDLLPRLTTAFNRVSVLETWSFMKTMKRQRAVARENGSPAWRSSPTELGAPLDTLFAFNRSAVQDWIENQAGEASAARAKTAAQGA